MKVKNTTTTIKNTVLALTACAGLNAFAGPAAKPEPPKTDDSFFATYGLKISGTLEAGWDSRYYFRGLFFADNTGWTGVSMSTPLTEQLTLGFGALYTVTPDTRVNSGRLDEPLDYSELDLTASLTYDFKIMKLGVVYTSYQFFDGFSGRTNPTGAFGAGEFNILHTNEVGVVASAALGPVNVFGGYYYDFNIGGSYIEVGADYPIKVLPWLTFVPSVKAGYGLDYYSNGAPENGGIAGGVTSGFTHLLVSFAAPVNLTKTATLTPYVAWNISGRARQALNAIDNEVFGGVKIGVSF